MTRQCLMRLSRLSEALKKRFIVAVTAGARQQTD
jgi:hypothetical protein